MRFICRKNQVRLSAGNVACVFYGDREMVNIPEASIEIFAADVAAKVQSQELIPYPEETADNEPRNDQDSGTS